MQDLKKHIATKKLAPDLRFKGFDEEWKETLLNNVAEFRKGKGISKSDIFDDGKLECIRYGELYTTYNELIVNVVSKTNLPLKGLELSEYNDVIIPASGETQLDIATASCVLKSGVALSGDLNIIRSSLNGIFLSFYLNNKKKREIAKLAQGSSVVHLYSSQLKSLKLNIPSLPEQQKIASFLTAVDDKLLALKQKHALLEQYKKGVMQKIFAQELRFKPSPIEALEIGDEYPDWEEKRLGELVKIKSGNSPSEYNFIEDGIYPFIKVEELNNCNKYQVISRFYSNNNKNLIEAKSVIFPKRGAAILNNKVRINESPILMDSNMMALIPLRNLLDVEFLYSQILEAELYKIADTSSIPQINNKHIEPFIILTPSLIEQQKIATFLSAIDEKIEKTTQQITQTQTFKKGLLQKMFV